MPIRRLEDTLTATTAPIAGEDIAASTFPVKPHIQPGVLQPAVAGKLLNGATHSGAYGTAQTQSGGDGHSYYYTDIKGSGPIKDPRIGAHFGSQRHMFKSKQLLEQETATHGSNTYSIDGRKWCRLVGSSWVIANSAYSSGSFQNDSCNDGTTEYFEVVAYCNALNFISYTASTYGKAKLISIDGSADTTTQEGFATVTTPLADRYVDAGSVIPLKTASLSLGIHTFRIGFVNNVVLYGIELIAQDTSSTANRSKIQIPAQNVVSYGKKFSISAATPHYDPFNGFTSGNLAAVQALIDTSTSLGMSNWLSGSTYYRPFNGGRVVKWIASDGTIKTSVTMMPPNAQNINTTASNAHTLGATNDNTINFDTSAIDHSLSEVAKTFDAREFGNGAANGGTLHGTYADASMLNAEDNIAYVMDDGFTSHAGEGVRRPSYHTMMANGTNDYNMFTFIGTGVTNKNRENAAGTRTIAQNLPYGTHIVRFKRLSNNATEYRLDGVEFGSTASACGETSEITFHQPKMPPIPDDACIIGDYMLMADFVAMNNTANTGDIGKGMRIISASRDILYNAGNTAGSLYQDGNSVNTSGFEWDSGASSAVSFALPFFGDSFTYFFSNHTTYAMVAPTLTVGGSVISTNVTPTGSYNTSTGVLTPAAGTTTGNNITLSGFDLGQTTGKVAFSGSISGNNRLRIEGFSVHTPIHTSSHYQSFETPFLNELVGGDRNMEQHNLIVTPDGKTWDEVTRDTSYIGTEVLNVMATTGNSAGGHLIPNGCRGTKSGRAGHNFWKTDYCTWAYDRMIFLKDGTYRISRDIKIVDSYSSGRLFHNGTSQANIVLQLGPNSEGTWEWWHGSVVLKIKRGEYIICEGYSGSSAAGDGFYIERIEK